MIKAARYVDQRKQRNAQAHALMGLEEAETGSGAFAVDTSGTLQQAAALRLHPVFI